MKTLGGRKQIEIRIPFFSIVVPVYNKEHCLKQFISGLLKQTFHDFELILVDDGSTDRSLEIMRQYTGLDKRIRVIENGSNKGIFAARKNGVRNAVGKYVWNIDPDDGLVSNKTLFRVKNLVTEHDVDILEVGANVIFNNDHNPDFRREVLSNLTPHNGALHDEEIVDNLIRENKFINSLCTKIVKRELIADVFEKLNEFGRAFMAADLLVTFPLMTYARTYYGVNAFKAYEYKYGIGVSNQFDYSDRKLETLVSQKNLITAWEHFFEKSENKEHYCEYIKYFKEELIGNCLLYWLGQDEKNSNSVLWCIVDTWSFSETFIAMASRFNHIENDVIEKSCGICIDRENKEIHTIGAYYPKLRNGGAEKVLSLLANLWINAGYKVVLFTEEEPNKDDYLIPEGVSRVILQNVDSDWKHNIRIREERLGEAVQTYGIDVFVYLDICCSAMYWDMRTVQANGAYFVINPHCTWSSIFPYLKWRVRDVIRTVRAADALVAISSDDFRFWKIINSNAYLSYNPVDPRFVGKERRSNGNTIVWVGRFDEGKRPLDVFPVMRKVVNSVPDAKLVMVGDVGDYKEKFLTERTNNGLNDNIVLAGFHNDVSCFYENAKVHLFTSGQEAMGLAILEAMAYGVPTTMYNLKNVDLVKDGRGIRVSEIGDTDSIADNIVELLTSEEVWNDASKKARSHFEEYCNFDRRKIWDELFKSLPLLDFSTEGLRSRVDSIGDATMEAIDSIYDDIRYLQDELNKANTVCGEVINSTSFKMGRQLTSLPRNIRDFFAGRKGMQ